MLVRILIAGMVLLLAIGCAKKGAKNTAPARDETASAKPQSATASDKDKKSEKADEPNLLTDPRFKKDPPNAPPADGSSPGKQLWVSSAPQGGWTAPNTGVQPPGAVPPVPTAPAPPVPAGNGAPQPAAPVPGVAPPPGVGVLQPLPAPVKPPVVTGGTPLGAAKKAVTMADMREVWIFIENASGASGKMPSQLDIYQALIKGGSPAAERVKDGTILLIGAKDRESVWAYEERALTSGGLVVSQNGVETLTAAELKARLGK